MIIMPEELTAKIKEVIQRAYNVKSVRVEVKEAIDYKAGQFLRVSLKEEDKFKKYLSISSCPTEIGYIEFTKKITESDFSGALDTLRAGDRLKIQYPFGKFTLKDSEVKIAFLSGGIGITPVRSICKYAVDKKLDTDIVLLYANRTTKDILFKEDFDAMQKQHPKLRVVYVLSIKPEAEGFKAVIGLINGQIIKNEVPDYALRKFYICGPVAMVEAMERILVDELALPKDNIITENFTGYNN